MDALIIKPTEHLPAISLIAETGRFVFYGKSLPEDGKVFYTPVLRWIEEYALSPAAKTECSFKMEYFNSSSSKCFADILNILDSIREKSHAVTIIWNFDEEDDEMREMGEQYQSIYKLDFHFRSYK